MENFITLLRLMKQTHCTVGVVELAKSELMAKLLAQKR